MEQTMRIGIIGDHDENRLSHRVTDAALRHAIEALGVQADAQWLPTEELAGSDPETLAGFDAFWCAPGSPYRSLEGALRGIRYARESGSPFLGTCGGFQHAALEYVRNVLGIPDARHAETDPDAPDLAVIPLACSLKGENHRVFLTPGTRCFDWYGVAEADEYFSCGYGLNPDYLERFQSTGFLVAATDENGEPRILELVQAGFHVATLFQPQFASTPDRPHPLILAFVREAVQTASRRREEATSHGLAL